MSKEIKSNVTVNPAKEDGKEVLGYILGCVYSDVVDGVREYTDVQKKFIRDRKEVEIDGSGDTYILPIFEDGTIGEKIYL